MADKNGPNMETGPKVIQQAVPLDGEMKVVVKKQPLDSSIMNINDKTDQLASNDSEELTSKDGEQDFTSNLTTLLNVKLEGNAAPDQFKLVQALQNQPQGTQFIVHIQDGPPVQVVIDGKLVPVSNVSQVLQNISPTVLPGTQQKPAEQPLNSRSHQKAGRKRQQKCVIFDEETQLSGASFKSQLLNTSDIVKGLDLAPPTKQVMEYTSTIDSDTLFGFPGRPHTSKQILNLFSQNLKVVTTDDKKRKKSKKQKSMAVQYGFCEDIVSWL